MTQVNVAALQLAFRDLKKLKPEDLDKVLTALAAIRREEK